MLKARSLVSSLQFMRGNILIMTITGATGMFCRSMAFPYTSLFILSLGGEPAQIGLINALSPLAGLIAFPIAGHLADRIGRVKMIAFAGFFSGSVLLLYVLARSWHWIAVARLLQGFLVVQFPPASALIADSLPSEQRGRGLATMNGISSGVAIGAPFVAGVLVDRLGPSTGVRILYAVMMVVYLLNAAINLLFLKEMPQEPREVPTGRLNLLRILKDAYAGIPGTLRQLPRSLKALTAVVTLGFVSNAIAGAFWVVYAQDQIGLSSSQWGLILLVETGLRCLMYAPAGIVVDRWGRSKTMLASLTLASVAIPAFVFARGFVPVLLVRAAVAAATAFFVTACSALMADTVSRQTRGRVMAAIGRGTVFLGASSGGTGGPGMGFVITIPVMVSSLVGGYLYGAHPAYPWIFVTVAMATSVALTGLLVRDPQRAEE